MQPWSFKDYWPDQNSCPIRDWYSGLPNRVKAVFDATVFDLRNTEDWNDPELRSFGRYTDKPEHLGLARIRFYVIEQQGKVQKKRHFRAVGIWYEGQREFVFLTGFEKFGRSTIPANALAMAVDLRTNLEVHRMGEVYDHV